MKYIVLMIAIVSFGFIAEDETPMPIDDQHLVIYGNIVEMLYGSDNEANAPTTRVIVYRDGEIFSAFKSNDKGEYVFNLPVGFEYVLSFGGDDFVNKRVIVNTDKIIESKRTKREVPMDISLFRPIDEIDYSAMEDPIVRWYFDKGAKQMVPDIDMVEYMFKKVDRLYRKSEKAALKASR